MKKRMSLMHIPAIILMYCFVRACCLEVCGSLYRWTDRLILTEYVFYGILRIAGSFVAAFLYAHYVLRKPLRECYVGKPLPKRKWCIVAVAMPGAMCLFYLFLARGTFRMEALSSDGLVYAVVFTLLGTGIVAPVVEELFFRGILNSALQKRWGVRGCALLTSLVFAVIHVGNIDMEDYRQVICIVFSCALAGLALFFVTIRTGSIWSAVVIHGLYNVLCGDGFLLHISVVRSESAVMNYILESPKWLLGGIPGAGEIQTGLPSMIGFAIILMLAWKEKKNSEADDFND